MSIEFVCPNGHKLKVKDESAGKIGLCPACKVRVQVPRKEASDEDVLAMLEPTVADQPQPQSPDVLSDLCRPPVPQKICPGCYAHASQSFTICPRCGTPLMEGSVARAK